MNRTILVALSSMLIVASLFILLCNTKTRSHSAAAKIAGHDVVRELKGQPGGITLSGPDCILQDEDGSFWIADPSGLYRYDAKADQWKIEFARGVGLIAKTLKSIWVAGVETDRPSLWCHSEQKWQQNAACGGPHVVGEVGAMFSSQSRRIWIITVTNELAAIGSEQSQSPIQVPRLRVGYAKTILEDRDGLVWIGAPEEVLRFDPKNQTWKHYDYPRSFDSAKGLYEDRSGNLWVAGLSDVVAVFGKDRDSWTSYNLRQHLAEGSDSSNGAGRLFGGAKAFLIRAICQDKEGKMLIGTNRGLFVFDQQRNQWDVFTAQNSSLPSDYITTLSRDRDGKIWIGTTNGIVVLD